MIHCLISFNIAKRLRITKWYSNYTQNNKNQIVETMISKIMEKKRQHSNFISINSRTLKLNPTENREFIIVYKKYAGLYFCILQDAYDNELLNMNVLNLVVDALDVVFVDVKELDVVMNFELSNFIIDEIILGGEIQEVSLEVIKEAVQNQHLLISAEIGVKKDSVIENLKEYVSSKLNNLM
eukprot:GAHX01002147.1.p1 GENE.GAHX01002147.1~~GAHX01002147.1.p1  ORF type:complete len:182 (+),score=32.62 GAHX01002147.1:174-719(+)